MLISISSKNKLGFIDGSIPEPTADEKFYSAWKRCNDLMISWILFNLDPTIAKSVLYLPTSKEIWDDLEERYGYVSAPQLYSLQQQVSEFVQGTKSIAEFFTEIKGIWDKISEACSLPTCICNQCTCNLTKKIFKQQQDLRLMQFLMKLNDEFGAVRGNILMMNPLPNLTQAYRLLMQEERHKALHYK